MTALNVPNELKGLENLGNGLVESPEPLLGMETIQIVLMREIHDYIVLRTEPSRELNTVVTPLTLDDMTPILRVVFLASKQKAVESRALRSLLKTARTDLGIKDTDCYFKDGLCMSCPRCILFGAVKVEKGKQEAIKHRIAYGSAFSLMPYEDVEMAFTFNAVSELTQRTDQALGTRFTVSPATVFPSIVTLRCVTWRELVLALKTLLSTTQYGAENRIGGTVRNHIVAIIAGWEEIITPLELTLETYTKSEDLNPTSGYLTTILEKYKNEATFKDKVQTISDETLDQLLEKVKAFALGKEFMEALDRDVESFKKKASGK